MMHSKSTRSVAKSDSLAALTKKEAKHQKSNLQSRKKTTNTGVVLDLNKVSKGLLSNIDVQKYVMTPIIG